MDKINLTDSEKRDIVKLIENGKPLPEKYHFLLFADKKEVALMWNKKTSEVSKKQRKIAIKIVDIFGNDTMKVVEVTV